MKDYPWREILKEAIPLLVVLVVYFAVMAAISAESIAWMMSGEAVSRPLQSKDVGTSFTSGQETASPLWGEAER